MQPDRHLLATDPKGRDRPRRSGRPARPARHPPLHAAPMFLDAGGCVVGRRLDPHGLVQPGALDEVIADERYSAGFAVRPEVVARWTGRAALLTKAGQGGRVIRRAPAIGIGWDRIS